MALTMLSGCFSRASTVTAIEEFCKGCEGRMNAELNINSWMSSFILKCDNFVITTEKSK